MTIATGISVVITSNSSETIAWSNYCSMSKRGIAAIA